MKIFFAICIDKIMLYRIIISMKTTIIIIMTLIAFLEYQIHSHEKGGSTCDDDNR